MPLSGMRMPPMAPPAGMIVPGGMMPHPMARAPMMGMPPPQQPPRPLSHPVPPEQQYDISFKNLVTSAQFASKDDEEKKELIGDLIFPAISKRVGEDDAGKITGMIIDQDVDEIISSVRTYSDLLSKIEEGKKLLDE